MNSTNKKILFILSLILFYNLTNKRERLFGFLKRRKNRVAPTNRVAPGPKQKRGRFPKKKWSSKLLSGSKWNKLSSTHPPIRKKNKPVAGVNKCSAKGGCKNASWVEGTSGTPEIIGSFREIKIKQRGTLF
jgi:hypothetical protein